MAVGVGSSAQPVRYPELSAASAFSVAVCACGACCYFWRLGLLLRSLSLLPPPLPLPRRRFLFLPCPRLLVLGPSLMPNAFPPRLGVSGDREEYCVARYCMRSLYVRVATLVLVDFHVPMGISELRASLQRIFEPLYLGDLTDLMRNLGKDIVIERVCD